MSTIEQFTPYVTIRTFADYTARQAMANIQQETTQPEPVFASKSDPTDTTPSPAISAEATRKQNLNDLSHTLAWLKNRRRLGEITRQDFTQQHKPLAAAYNRLLVEHMGYIQEMR